MTRQEILEKAIQKAIEGGWKPEHPVYGDTWKGKWYLLVGVTVSEIASIFDPLEYESRGYECLIYSHDFARALWGEELVDVNLGTPQAYSIDAWKYHLQEMVISDDPIEYLGKNLPD